jgi:O-methyltransferase
MVKRAIRRFLIRHPSLLPRDGFEPEIEQLYESVRPFTMTSIHRVAALADAVEYVCRSRIPGDIVECGVWRGGSTMAAARTLIRLGDKSRRLYLFDTFEGMPPPTADDLDRDGVPARALLDADAGRTGPMWARATLGDVQENLRSTGYPSDLIVFAKGKVENTIPGQAPEQIAILRLDTDWYESTAHELTHLYPRLVEGGVLIIDDYGYWQGARKAVDEYIARHKIALLLSRIDDTGRMATKPADQQVQ